jgi:phage terminase large subunit-like protein
MEQYSLAYENSLFIQPEILLGDVTSEDDIPILWDEVVNLNYVSEADPNIVRACHVDVGLTEDALGLCVGHIGGTVTVSAGQRFDEAQNRFIDVQNIQAPAFVIDGVLRVRSRRGTQVDLNRVRDLLLFIHNHLPFRWFSADAFQSAQLISAMRGVRIRAGVQSVDTTLLPYTELRNAYHDRRIIHPNHPVLYRELIGLMRKVESGNRIKIDHGNEGSKDCSDALAAVCYCLAVREARHLQVSPTRERKSERVQRRLKGDTPMEKQSRRRGTGEGRVDRMIRVRKRR